MCSNHRPVTRADRMLAFFGVTREWDEEPVDIFPLGLAPFIRRAEDGSCNKRVDDGVFGLLPHFAKELAYGRKTYNARSETVHQLANFTFTVSRRGRRGSAASSRPRPFSSLATRAAWPCAGRSSIRVRSASAWRASIGAGEPPAGKRS